MRIFDVRYNRRFAWHEIRANEEKKKEKREEKKEEEMEKGEKVKREIKER